MIRALYKKKYLLTFLLIIGLMPFAQLFAAQDILRVNHALLVGVSQYPELDPRLRLQGPLNDVALWRDFLLERGVSPEAIHILADGMQDSQLPTREAILEHLEELAKQAQDGDFIFLMFAGHGAQQPASEETWMHEPDGLDEIFLPYDVRGWDDANATVENAILDAEFKRLLDAIRAQGAFIWAIFDTCHSATMTRGPLDAELRYRQVSSQDLGIPQEVIHNAQQRAQTMPLRTRGHSPTQATSDDDVTDHLRGGLVAFYAAQSTEETPERRMPIGSEHARDYGVFTYTLHQALSAAPNATYRQILDNVIQRYQTMPSVRSIPLAEGTHLDHIVFRAEESSLRQWRIHNNGRSLRLAAGELHALGVGSILAVVASATDDDEAIFAYVSIDSIALTSAHVVPVEFAGHEPVDIQEFPAYTFARPVMTALDFSLDVEILQGEHQGVVCTPPGPSLLAAIEHLKEHVSTPVHFNFSAPKDPYIYLCQHDAHLYLINQNTIIAAADTQDEAKTPLRIFAPSIPITDKVEALAHALAEDLTHVARVYNILRIASHTGSGTRIVDTEFYVRQRDTSDPPICEALNQPQAISGSELIEMGRFHELREGDCISLFITNTTHTPVDITILFVSANYAISPLWPGPNELHNTRIEGGGHLAIGEFEAYADSLGRDQIIVFAIPVTTRSQPEDLRFLAQPSISGSSRGNVQAGSIRELFMIANFDGTTSRAYRRPPSSRTSAMQTAIYPSRVIP